MFKGVDCFEPTKCRLLASFKDNFKYCVPLEGRNYTVQETLNVKNHSGCFLCNVLIEEQNNNFCYFFTSGTLKEGDYAYNYGIPQELKKFHSVSKEKEKSLKRKYPFEGKKESIFCPCHDDKHKSAIRNSDGRIFCFKSGKIVSE
jgi:hypothetical protein